MCLGEGVAALGRVIGLDRKTATGTPLIQTFALDETGEGFIECGIPRDIEPLMGQLVEDQRCKTVVVPAQHGVERASLAWRRRR